MQPASFTPNSFVFRIAQFDAVNGNMVGFRQFDSAGQEVQTTWTSHPDITFNVVIAADGTMFSGALQTKGALHVIRSDFSVSEVTVPHLDRSSGWEGVLAPAPDGNIVVATDKSVSKLTPTGALVWTSPTDKTYSSLVADAKGRIWACQTQIGFSLAVLDGSSGAVWRSIGLPGNGCVVAGNSEHVYLLTNGRIYEVAAE